jgi:hypothetical protein
MPAASLIGFTRSSSATIPGAAKLELFARETRPGWDSWGAQTGLFDQGTIATPRWPSAGVGVGEQVEREYELYII